MNLKTISVGGGLALLALAVVVNAGVSLITAFSTQAHAGTGAVGNAVVSAAVGQGGGEPTIVWYGVSPPVGTTAYTLYGFVFRAWSDGRVEMKPFAASNSSNPCYATINSNCDWVPFSNPNDGLAAFSDLNADGKVDAVDLSQVLSRWGDAPRNDIPPSDCPLNLINP